MTSRGKITQANSLDELINDFKHHVYEWAKGDYSVIELAKDEVALKQAIQKLINKARIEGRAEVLREVLDNPNRKSYYIELLNQALKELKQFNQLQTNKELKGSNNEASIR